MKKPNIKDLGIKWRDAKEAALQSPRTRAALAKMGKARDAALNLPGARTTLSKWREFTEVYSGTSCLGIHYTPGDITAVLLEKGKDGLERAAAVHFKIEQPAQELETADTDSAPDDIALQTLRELYTKMLPANGKAHPVALSLGAEFYQVQFHHSDFDQTEQIKQTLRFDIEDEFVVDGENIFLCFQQLPTPAQGCDLMVYTADREKLIWTTRQFEQAGLDALVAEPDIVSWMHYLGNLDDLVVDQGLIVVGRCAESIYLLILNQDDQPILSRNLFCPEGANCEEFMTRELSRCLALTENPPNRLVYHGQGFNRSEMKALSRTLSLDVQELPQQSIQEAFAEGVARGLLEARVQSDFRIDGLVPRTMEKARHKALFWLFIAASLFLLVSIIVMKSKTSYYGDVSQLAKDHVVSAWNEIPHSGGRGKKINPSRAIEQIKSKLRKMKESYERMNANTASKDLPESINSTFRLFMTSLQPLPDEFDLAIDSLRLHSDSVDLSGTVANLDSCQKLEEAVKAERDFRIEKWDYNPLGKRWEYTMAVSAKNSGQKKGSGRGKRNRHANKN